MLKRRKSKKKMAKPNMARNIKKLIVTHKILFITAVIALVASVGFVGYSAWQQLSADAAGENALTDVQRQYVISVHTKLGCRLSGREWNDATNDCKTRCRIDGVKYIKATEDSRGYCEGYLATAVGQRRCIDELHRYYVAETGCARRPNQENTNDSPQCIPGFPNYLAEQDGVADKCVARELPNANQGTGTVPPPKPTPTPTPTPPPAPDPTPTLLPPPETDTARDCQLLGREWDSKAKKCKAVCMAGAGKLTTGVRSGVKYCDKAVGVTQKGTQALCSETLHRVWLVEGCARRPDQKDAKRTEKEDLIQCLPKYNFYNANFNNKLEDKETLTDVCELSEAAAKRNEKAGTPGQVKPPSTSPEQPGDEDDSDVPTDPNEPQTGEYKIIVYTERDFKGASRVIQSDTPELDGGWDNNIESYKIISGRWKLCEDAGYQTNCIKPWASDPDMRVPRKDDGKKRSTSEQQNWDDENRRTSLSNRVSSLRPVPLKTLEDTVEDVKPACVTQDGTETVAYEEDGNCPKGTILKCPDGLVLKNRECKQVVLSPSLVVPVDDSFKGENGKRLCHLLGREWIDKPEDGEVDNAGRYGCSIVTCRYERDGRPKRVIYDEKDKDGRLTDSYCVSYKYDVPYAVKLDKDPVQSKKKCQERNRVWIEQVRLCAQVPNRKDRNQTIVDAPQCQGDGRVYYIFKETTKMDECFTKTTFQNAQSVVKSAGGVLDAALRQGPRAYCNTFKKGNYHWNGEKCVIDRKTCPDGKSVPVTQVCYKKCPDGKRVPASRNCPSSQGGGTGTGQGAGDTKAPSGESWSTFCNRIGRAVSGSSCASPCLSSSRARNPQHLSYGWDYCDPKGDVCSHYGTGGTKNCGSGPLHTTCRTAKNQGLDPNNNTFYCTSKSTCLSWIGYGYKAWKDPYTISNYFGSGRTLYIDDGACLKD